jgi:16S rRNA (guanine527-N7)-methyltransferase
MTDDVLITELERAQRLGFLGPGPVAVHVTHARGFAAGLVAPPGRFLDLGSGGGVPGLVLALDWPDSSAVLLDAGERRCAFLQEAVERLGIDGRINVVRQRAEEAGRSPSLRAGFDLVVSRSFGPPAVTAECAAPFLRVGGLLVVSEPPDSGPDPDPDPDGPDAGPAGGAGLAGRWLADGLAQLGLALGDAWRGEHGYQSLVQREPCPERYPRRVGQVAKRPLF